MVVMHAPEGRNEAPTEEAPRSRGEGEAYSAPSERLASRDHLTSIVRLLTRLVRIRMTRARLRADRTVFVVAGGILGAIVAVALVLSAALLLVRGLTAGLVELLGGRVWLAELTSGFLLLAATATALLVIRALRERRMLRDLLERGGDERSS